MDTVHLDAVTARLKRTVLQLPAPVLRGRVKQVLGTLIEGQAAGACVGELCELRLSDEPTDCMLAEVVGFNGSNVLLSALEALEGVSPATEIRPLGTRHSIPVGPELFGRVLDGFGRPLDGKPLPPIQQVVPAIRDAPPPTERPRITQPFATGVRAIDGLITLGYGQRVGVFAGPGCGKTTLLAAIARGAAVDAVVFGLIGERGRELREFLEHEMDETLVAKSVLVCATSDRTSMERARAAFTATAVAEGLRDQGYRVLLLIDSLTRFGRAQREIGLAAGEPPTRGGFPPSVYTLLPRLIERAGNTQQGSITAIYTVLAESEGPADPLGEEAKSLLDGHIVLPRKLAEQGHYPAIDVLASLSRIMDNIVPKQQVSAARKLRQWLAQYRELELLIRLGEYRAGQDAASDQAVQMQPALKSWLQQDTRDTSPFEKTCTQLASLSSGNGT
ncbi:FliI/YscN family ATPase [Chitinivorax sp. B]|uniref:FliI/YscN family ATPase n=1 Tax=Chitinivorax sp. B TaxID=2502235 RepID=UPI0010F80406|nr:FliI/YscN family ATPase [Chitinivorax sp. B]